MSAPHRVAVEVQRAVGPLFNRGALKAGSLSARSDDARIICSQNGGAYGRSRKQGEAEKRAHGNREGCEEGRHIPTIDHVGRWANAKSSIPLWSEGSAAVTTGPAECRARVAGAAWASASCSHASSNALHAESQQVADGRVGLATIRRWGRGPTSHELDLN